MQLQIYDQLLDNPFLLDHAATPKTVLFPLIKLDLALSSFKALNYYVQLHCKDILLCQAQL